MKYEKNLASIVSLIKGGEKNRKDFKIGVGLGHIIVQIGRASCRERV